MIFINKAYLPVKILSYFEHLLYMWFRACNFLQSKSQFPMHQRDMSFQEAGIPAGECALYTSRSSTPPFNAGLKESLFVAENKVCWWIRVFPTNQFLDSHISYMRHNFIFVSNACNNVAINTMGVLLNSVERRLASTVGSPFVCPVAS